MRTIALALLALLLMGAKTALHHPACTEDPEQLDYFIQALQARDDLAVGFYLQMGCGLLKGGIEAAVLERGDRWIKIRAWPPELMGEFIDVYTDPGGVVEEGI